MSLNQAQLIGHLGQDPDIKSTQDGREIANISVATSERWKDKNTGEQKEKTEWHRVVIFNEGLVKVAKNYLKKGAKVFVQGEIRTRKWADKDGVDRYSTEIVLPAYSGKIDMLDKRENDGSSKANAQAEAYDNNSYSADKVQRNVAPDLDDDIPFGFILPLIMSFASLGGIA